jgi:uncharacterized protein (DUF2236 family)
MAPSRSPSPADGAQALAELVASRARGKREGLFGPESVMWRVARETVLLAGGPRALLLQLAHPAVLSGVMQHSQVATDPLGRSVRTFEAMYTLSFGDLESALKVVRTVWKRHQSVRGHILEGTRSPLAGAHYHATDPRLLAWVWATLHDTMVRMFETFVRPLSQKELARLYEEGKLVQMAFGMPETEIPPTRGDFEAYVNGVIDGPDLDVPVQARQQWELLVRQPPSHGLVGALMLPKGKGVKLLLDGSPVRVLAPAAARLLAAGTLPPRLREAYGFRWSRSDAALFRVFVEGVRASVAVMPGQLRYHAAYRKAVERVAERKAAG